MATILFLDTEWADAIGLELVSLAMASEDGSRRFYSEVSPLPKNPTDFVQRVVYPLLEHGNAARQRIDLTRDLRAFLATVPEPVVLADYPNDLHLLRYALAGFDLPDDQAQACGPIPRPVMTHMLKEGATGMLVEAYFEAHPQIQARRHHALVDAEALRLAWLVVTGRIKCPAWAASTMQRMSSIE